MPRDTKGYTIVETWDTLGMRPTRSDDTILDGAFVPDKYIARVVPAGFAGADLFVLGIFAWAECTFASIYTAIAERALELAVATAGKRTSVALGGRAMKYHPEIQHEIADMAIELEGSIPHVERTAADWSNGVDHGGLWPMKLVATKYHAVESAKRVVDLAMDVSGGSGMFKTQSSSAYRDVRCGGFHPRTTLVHELVGKTRRASLARAAGRRVPLVVVILGELRGHEDHFTFGPWTVNRVAIPSAGDPTAARPVETVQRLGELARTASASTTTT
jgi:alkylation response protein AidB-like acyl-CoA dehydrogenase